MPKNTSTGSNGSGSKAARKRSAPGRKQTPAIVDARAEAARIRREAETDAARIRAEAEEHARRLVLDARASADGVRGEGMELVSNLREMGAVLRSNAERLLRDIEAIHSRMVGQLEGVAPAQEAGVARADGELATADDEPLEVPDFIAAANPPAGR